MTSEWAYKIAREQRHDVETMAANLDAARAEGKAEGRIVGLEEAAGIVETAPNVGTLADGDTFWRGQQNFANDIRARIKQEPTS